MTTYYKFLRKGGYGTHAIGYRWNLPTDGQPAAWEPEIEGNLIPCENGYHVLTLDHWTSWASDELYEVETRGELLDDGEKLVAREARLIRRLDGWNETNVRLFAADCAERVLPIWEHVYPDDARPRLAIEAARDYAHGRIVGSILRAAHASAQASARASAQAAARAAARASARASAGASAWASSGASAGAAAGAAAWASSHASSQASSQASAWDAAGDAAGDAARAAERSWQLAKLREYLGIEE